MDVRLSSFQAGDVAGLCSSPEPPSARHAPRRYARRAPRNCVQRSRVRKHSRKNLATKRSRRRRSRRHYSRRPPCPTGTHHRSPRDPGYRGVTPRRQPAGAPAVRRHGSGFCWQAAVPPVWPFQRVFQRGMSCASRGSAYGQAARSGVLPGAEGNAGFAAAQPGSVEGAPAPGAWASLAKLSPMFAPQRLPRRCSRRRNATHHEGLLLSSGDPGNEFPECPAVSQPR